MKRDIERTLNLCIDYYVHVDKVWSGMEYGTNVTIIINCTYLVQFGAGWHRIPSKLE